MLKDYLQISTLSLVLVGDFNPVIIQPSWLSSKKLIREQEGKDAKIDLIHNELVRFDLEWCLVEVTKNKMQIRTSKEPYFEAVRDLMINIFEILRETPVKALGINFIFHYALPDKERYYDFGNKLAPLNNWGKFMKEPRMLQLEILEKPRQDGLDGYYRVKVLPSEQKLTTPFAISVNINDHFSVKPEETGRNLEMVKMLREKWGDSNKRASEIPEEIWKIVS